MDKNQPAAELLVKQANFFHREGDYEQAIAAYQEAIALMPTSPTFLAYHFMIGDMLFERQRYGEAAAAFREAVQAVPHYEEAWFYLGKCLIELEQYEEAVQVFERCLEMMTPQTGGGGFDPWVDFEAQERISQVWYLGALAHARLGHTAEAKRYLAEALQRKPSWKRRAQQEPVLCELL